MSARKICKDYLIELEHKEKEFDIYNDKVFAPGAQLADVFFDLFYLDQRIMSAEEKSKKEARLFEKKNVLLAEFNEIEKEEPSLDMHSLSMVKALAQGKTLDNDSLCEVMTNITKKKWSWKPSFDGKIRENHIYPYGITFIQRDFEFNCFFGTTKNIFEAQRITKQLNEINWFEAITDIEARDEYKCHATCLRIPPQIRKGIMSELTRQCHAEEMKTQDVLPQQEKVLG